MLLQHCRVSGWIGSRCILPCQFQRRWAGSAKRTVSDEKQLFPKRRILKEIDRRIRVVQMQATIMNDLGINKESATNKDQSEESPIPVISARFLASNTSKFSDDLAAINRSDITSAKRNTVEEAMANPVRRIDNIRLPLGQFAAVEYPEPKETQSVQEKSADFGITYDRGFHVEGDVYKDEYVAGTLLDLPVEEEMKHNTLTDPELDSDSSSSSLTRTDRQIMRKNRPYRIRHGPEDAVEEIDFLLPTQEPINDEEMPRNLKKKKDILDDRGFGEETENESWKQYYGGVDRSVKPADDQHRCVGCGATFHCQDSSLPGFLPASLFLEKETANDFAGTQCRRCYLLKRHQFLVNVSVSSIDYERVLGHLRTIQEALIILLVDMTDFPACIFPKLPDLIGHGKPMIVVGTKIDLLPPDAEPGYIRHFQRCLRKAVVEMGFAQRMNLLDVLLVSAKTGYGVEELISMVFSKWANRGNIYLIGCTNTGKSTLFNAFLQSDLCKIRAVDLVERATTSLWPGTTLNLLKFPMMNPTNYRLIERNRRLRTLRRYADAEEQHRRVLLEQTGNSKYMVLQGAVDRTPHFEMNDPEQIDDEENENSKIIRPKTHFARKEIVGGRWCFDTPGTVHHEQIINYLTLDELIKTVPRSMLQPRTFALGYNETVLIGGLARIDFLSGPSGTLLTIFASDQLPIHVEDTPLVEDMYKTYVGTAALAVPYGDQKRLDEFPRLKRQVVKLMGAGFNEACADVTLSSVGWTAVTAKRDTQLKLGVWTPGGVGVFVRTPALLPFVVYQRGSRIKASNAYETRPITFPSDKERKRT